MAGSCRSGDPLNSIISGRLRALATPAAQRLSKYPDVPTLAELGFPNVAVTAWDGVVAPTGTPKEVVSRLHFGIQKVVAMPETKQRFEAIGLEPADARPEEFAGYIRSELQKWNKVVRDAGIKAD